MNICEIVTGIKGANEDKMAGENGVQGRKRIEVAQQRGYRGGRGQGNILNT